MRNLNHRKLPQNLQSKDFQNPRLPQFVETCLIDFTSFTKSVGVLRACLYYTVKISTT